MSEDSQAGLAPPIQRVGNPESARLGGWREQLDSQLSPFRGHPFPLSTNSAAGLGKLRPVETENEHPPRREDARIHIFFLT